LVVHLLGKKAYIHITYRLELMIDDKRDSTYNSVPIHPLRNSRNEYFDYPFPHGLPTRTGAGETGGNRDIISS
jgi:hypothetical protein